MPVLIYCDTNFYLDYFFDRRDNLRPLGEFAYQVLRRCFDCEFSIVVSDLVLDEIRRNGGEKRMDELIVELKKVNKFVYVSTTKNDKNKAKSLPTHAADALHVVLASKSGAKFLVTTNLDDFLPCSDIIICVLPMELPIDL